MVDASSGAATLRTVGAMLAVSFCLAEVGCSQTTTRPLPITAEQQAQLTELAAGPDAPEGLSEVLAGIEAHQRRQDCLAGINDTIRQMQVMGAVSTAVGIAGGMAGTGGKAASKMLAIAQGKVMRAKVSHMPTCSG